MQYRIVWQSKFTGHTGHGDWIAADLLDWLLDQRCCADRLFPDMDHWIEERDETTTTRPQAAATAEASTPAETE